MLHAPPRDPSALFELFRGSYATELLTVAVSHLGFFPVMAERPLTFLELAQALKLASRPTHVLLTALRAFGLVRVAAGRFELTDLARDHLLPGRPFDVSAYIGLAAKSPGVLEMLERLRTNLPAGAKPNEQGAAFIFREGLESAMEQAESARSLTLALAGRARNVAPVLAARYPLPQCQQLLDVGGGSGLYSIAYLQTHPKLRAIVWDRPAVLAVAREVAEREGVADRLTCVPGDMFADPPPAGCDAVLFSNILHDWDIPQCQQLLASCASMLPRGGQLLIHDVFLHDEQDGPLPLALYSAALFTLTEGRLYSAAEYRGWLTSCGLTPGAVVPTLIHCGVLPASKI